MSEMFTKCNGFIVSGDPLVYADSATMSGQGTVSEPFGVKSTDLFVQEPLYTGTSGNSAYIGWNNETVLWEAATTANATSAGNFNESPFNFERIGVYWLMNNDGTLQSPTYQEFPTLENTTYYLNAGFGNSYCYIGKVHFNVGSASFSSTKAQGIQIANWNATATIASIDTNYLTKMRNGFYKIVGIDRKA